MRRSRNYDKEFSQNDRLKKENSELKRELSKLRKMIDRLNIDVEQFQGLRKLVEQQNEETKNVSKSKKDWTCFKCGRGVMQLKIHPRRDGPHYIRLCSFKECGNRTKMKRYNNKVEPS